MKKTLFIVSLIFLTTYAFAQDKPAIKVEELAKATATWDGATLPEYPNGQPEVTILKITIPPKTALPNHTHPVINAGVLLKGELTVTTEDKKTIHLKAGDALIEVTNTWHFGKNDGNEPAEIIVFYAGIKDSSISIKETKK